MQGLDALCELFHCDEDIEQFTFRIRCGIAVDSATDFFKSLQFWLRRPYVSRTDFERVFVTAKINLKVRNKDIERLIFPFCVPEYLIGREVLRQGLLIPPRVIAGLRGAKLPVNASFQRANSGRVKLLQNAFSATLIMRLVTNDGSSGIQSPVNRKFSQEWSAVAFPA